MLRLSKPDINLKNELCGSSLKHGVPGISIDISMSELLLNLHQSIVLLYSFGSTQ